MDDNRSNSKKTVAGLLIFAVIMVIFLFSVNFTAKGNIGRQKQSLTEALERDVTYCYATTGRYPKTLGYIEKAYGLTYDKDIFNVEYKVRGSRIPPEITVTEIGEGK